MKLKPLFVSTSKYKIEEFKIIVNSRFDFSIINEEYPDIIEIQGTKEEVVIDKAIKAYQMFKRPVIVDDEGLNIVELNGFPGPYLKDFQNTLKNEGMYNIFKKLNATLISYVIYAITYNGIDVFQFYGETEFKPIIYREDKQNDANYWEVITHNSVENNLRLSQLKPEEKNYNWYMRKQAIDKLTEYIKAI